ncbi:MAG: hypothetical protein ACJA0X_001470 [Cyclobacteriaceae bacterium]|jgi:hypothetical protein
MEREKAFPKAILLSNEAINAVKITVKVSQVGDSSFNAATEVVVNFAVKEVLNLEKSLSGINVYPSTASYFVKINSQKEAA